MPIAPAAGLGAGAGAGSGRVLLALAPLILLLAALVVYCLIDLARAAAVRYLPKAVWALVILFASWPFGALAYLIFGKDRGDGRHHAGGHGRLRAER